MSLGPTQRQLQILRFIVESTVSAGSPPSIREIGDAFEIRSTNGVNDHLRALMRKGLLEGSAVADRKRSIRATRQGLRELGFKWCPTCHQLAPGSVISARDAVSHG